MPTAGFRQGFSLRCSARTPDQLPGENGLPARHDLVEDARLIGLLCRVLRHAGGEHDRQSGDQGWASRPGNSGARSATSCCRYSLANSVMRFSSGAVSVIRSVIGASPSRMPVSTARHVPMNAFATSQIYTSLTSTTSQPRTFERPKRKLNAVIPVYSARGRWALHALASQSSGSLAVSERRAP